MVANKCYRPGIHWVTRFWLGQCLHFLSFAQLNAKLRCCLYPYWSQHILIQQHEWCLHWHQSLDVEEGKIGDSLMIESGHLCAAHWKDYRVLHIHFLPISTFKWHKHHRHTAQNQWHPQLGVTIDDYPCWVVSKDGHSRIKPSLTMWTLLFLREDLSSPGVSPNWNLMLRGKHRKTRWLHVPQCPKCRCWLGWSFWLELPYKNNRAGKKETGFDL